MLSAAVRLLLAEDVFPRVRLTRGMPLALSLLVQYVLIFGGFPLALAALGVDLTKLTILAGALGVGVGLGLQGLVNNFASGLILLLERPIHVGDVVQLTGVSGEVRHIGAARRWCVPPTARRCSSQLPAHRAGPHQLDLLRSAAKNRDAGQGGLRGGAPAGHRAVDRGRGEARR